MPAKGIRCSAVATDCALVCNQMPASSGLCGSDPRSNYTLAISSNEKRMPAMAAARGARRNCAAVVAESGGIMFARAELRGRYGLCPETDPDQEKAFRRGRWNPPQHTPGSHGTAGIAFGGQAAHPLRIARRPPPQSARAWPVRVVTVLDIEASS